MVMMHNGKEIFTIGNESLLSLHKTGFLASRTIEAQSVLKCYDWACKERDNGDCVISGFSSKLEKDVFHFLLKGTQPIILVLGRALYKTIPKELIKPCERGTLLIISPVQQNVTRQSEQSAFVRNKFIVENADKMVFASVTQKSSLWSLYQSNLEKCIEL